MQDKLKSNQICLTTQIDPNFDLTPKTTKLIKQDESQVLITLFFWHFLLLLSSRSGGGAAPPTVGAEMAAGEVPPLAPTFNLRSSRFLFSANFANKLGQYDSTVKLAAFTNAAIFSAVTVIPSP